eukprot:55800-Eustigmatos_ZCMA.PRE.1
MVQILLVAFGSRVVGLRPVAVEHVPLSMRVRVALVHAHCPLALLHPECILDVQHTQRTRHEALICQSET